MVGTVQGTSSADTIDVAYLGDPNGDRIDNADATLAGAAPNDDLVYAKEGNDIVNAGEGDDVVFGGADDDSLFGGTGDDTLNGDAGQDIVFGEEGDDVLNGGDGDDTLKGGTGNDVLTGGTGADLQFGEADADSFIGGNNGDEVYGGAAGDDLDVLDLRGLPPYILTNIVPDSNGNGVNGTVVFVDADGNPTGESFQFEEIERIIEDEEPNKNPDAVNDAATTGVATLVNINVLGNDSDPEGDALTITSASAANGTVAILPDGTVDYTPNPGFTGTDTITYSISDGNGGTDTAIVTVTVNPVAGPDGTVEGTNGDDLIDTSYAGDPEGDFVDNNDAILPGDTGNDDLIIADGGNDTVLAGDGDDVAFGGAGDDTLDGDTGNDELHGSTGNDSVFGDTGNDTVYGGAGNDVIDSSDGGFGLFDNPYPPLPIDPFPSNDLDAVYGGSGDDTIRTGDDRDTLFGGDGNDTLNAGIDDDVAAGGRGDDTIIGGEGNDIIRGNDGNDTIYGGLDPSFPDAINIPDDAGDLVPDNGLDTIYGGEGDDTIFGMDDDDTIYGGAGNDTIDGGVDDDVAEGGLGNDTLTGGQGNDVLTGGDDRDVFLGGNGGDSVDGSSGGDDFDTLNLTGTGVDFITYTSPDREDGIVTFLDGTTMSFIEIENVIPCFTPGTAIATPRGERLVEELREGDRIITRDNGIQEIRWVGHKDVSGKALVNAPHLKPVLIKAGALGNGLPERDMLVSPNHRVLVANDRTQLYFEESEVLAAAKHLIGAPGIHEVDMLNTTYIHFMFDRHEVVLSNGAWTESFQPGDYSLKGIGNAQRNEILELFPELKTKQGLEGYQAARKSLKRHEAQLLVR